MDALRDSGLLSHPAPRARRMRWRCRGEASPRRPSGSWSSSSRSRGCRRLFVGGFAQCFVFINTYKGLYSCIALCVLGALGARYTSRITHDLAELGAGWIHISRIVVEGSHLWLAYVKHCGELRSFVGRIHVH